MTINKITLISILIIAFSFQSCHKGGMWGIKGEGATVNEKRDLTGFTEIHVSMDCNVSYVQDSVYSIEITGQKNILSVLETKVEGQTLVMDFKRNVWKYNTLYMVIHAPNLNNMQISGSGNISVLNSLSASSLYCNISGSGNISVSSVSVQSLELIVSGSGNININEGSCKNANFTVSGSGSIRAEYLVTENANAVVSGSGKIVLTCKESLKVRISGSGSISYRGNPSVSKEISGSGRLIHLD